MKQKIYKGCPIDRDTWYSIPCKECIYAIYDGDTITGCSNYDEIEVNDDEKRKYTIIVDWYDTKHKKHSKTWGKYETAAGAETVLYELKKRGYKCVIVYI